MPVIIIYSWRPDMAPKSPARITVWRLCLAWGSQSQLHGLQDPTHRHLSGEIWFKATSKSWFFLLNTHVCPSDPATPHVSYSGCKEGGSGTVTRAWSRVLWCAMGAPFQKSKETEHDKQKIMFHFAVPVRRILILCFVSRRKGPDKGWESNSAMYEEEESKQRNHL